MALNTPSSEAKKVESAMTNILHNWGVNVKGKIYLVGRLGYLVSDRKQPFLSFPHVLSGNLLPEIARFRPKECRNDIDEQVFVQTLFSMNL